MASENLQPAESAQPKSAAPWGSRQSFATVLNAKRRAPLIPDVPLASRQYGTKNGVPAVGFTAAEFSALSNRFRHTLVAKFQAGRPHISVIRSFAEEHWKVKGVFSCSSKWDGRHIVFVFESDEDANVALTCPARKVQNAYFRLFRWTPNYDPKKESTLVTKWIRLPNLAIPYFSKEGIKAIVSSFGRFLAVDDATLDFNSMSMGRACVEIDVSKKIPNQVWVHVGNEGYFQDVVIEGGIAYCMKCMLHGHDVSSCRKGENPKKPPGPMVPSTKAAAVIASTEASDGINEDKGDKDVVPSKGKEMGTNWTLVRKKKFRGNKRLKAKRVIGGSGVSDGNLKLQVVKEILNSEENLVMPSLPNTLEALGPALDAEDAPSDALTGMDPKVNPKENEEEIPAVELITKETAVLSRESKKPTMSFDELRNQVKLMGIRLPSSTSSVSSVQNAEASTSLEEANV